MRAMTEPTRPSFPFSGTVTLPEFERIQTQLTPAWARRGVLHAVMAVALATVALVDRSLPELLAFALLFAAFVALRRVFARRAHERAWKRAVQLGGRMHGDISAQGILWNTERSSTRFEWANVLRLDQAEGLTLAYYTPRCAFFFPRSFFESDAAWTAFNEAIAGWVPAR